MKRLFTQVILSVFCIQLIMSSFISVNVFAVAPLVNLVECGDMETDTVPEKWADGYNSTYYSPGYVGEIVVDSKDSTNRVYRFDGTNNTGNLSYICYDEPLVSGKEYYYSYKIRLAENDTNTGNLYVYMGLTGGKTPYDTYRPLLSKDEWATCSGTLTGEGKRMSFKIISEQGTSSKNKANVIYELDDVIICETPFGEELTVSDESNLNGTTLEWKTGIIKQGNVLYARAGSVASFCLTSPDQYTKTSSVKVNDEIVSCDNNGIYEITIPDNFQIVIDVEVEVDNVPKLLSVSPENIDNADAQNMYIDVTFDRNMDITSFNSNNIIVTPQASFEVEDKGDSTYRIKFDELMEATQYTVVFSEDLLSELEVAMENSYTYTFATASSCLNIIENGDMNDTANTSIYFDNGQNSISYVTEDGNSVLKWKASFNNAPLIQYLNDDNRSQKYDFIAGHTYYVKARVKAEEATSVDLRILYVTQTDTTTNQHSKKEVSLEADKWTVLHNVFTVPGNITLEKKHGIRFGSGSVYPNTIYIDDVELIDCSVNPQGKPSLVSSYPENGADDIKVGKGNLEMTLTFDMPLLPTKVDTTNITAKDAVIDDIKLSEDKKTCILSLSQLKVNKTVKISYKNLTSMAMTKVDDGSISFGTEKMSTATPLIEKITPANGEKIGLKSFKNIEIVYDLPLEGPVDKSSFATVPQNFIESVNWSEDKPDTINIKVNQECLIAGNTYSVTVLNSIKSLASTPVNEETITYQIITSDEITQEFKDILSSASENKNQEVLDFINVYYSELTDNDTLCKNILEKEEALAQKLVEQIIANGVNEDADADDVLEKIEENAVLATVNYSQKEELIDDAINTILISNDITALLDTYTSLEEDVKDEFCGNIKELTNDFKKSEDFINYLKPQIIFTAVKNAGGWKAISDALNNNIEFLSDSTKSLIKKVNDAKRKTEMYLRLQGKDILSEDGLYTALNNAYNELSSSSSGSSSGGGGGGKTTFTPAVQVETPTENVQNLTGFKDIESVPWAKEAIEHFYKLNVISGKTADAFCPNDFVTREEFVKMIVVAANIPMAENGNKFSDVDQNAWYYSYVLAATNSKLVQGIDSLNFGIGQNITRQDIATICNRLLGASDGENALSEEDENIITDYDDISEYAKEAVDRLVSLDIIKGDENGRFAPLRFATRAETAVLLQRLVAFRNAEGR